MVKSVQISQKFDFLTPKIMLNIGQIYQLYIQSQSFMTKLVHGKNFKNRRNRN